MQCAWATKMTTFCWSIGLLAEFLRWHLINYPTFAVSKLKTNDDVLNTTGTPTINRTKAHKLLSGLHWAIGSNQLSFHWSKLCSKMWMELNHVLMAFSKEATITCKISPTISLSGKIAAFGDNLYKTTKLCFVAQRSQSSPKFCSPRKHSDA